MRRDSAGGLEVSGLVLAVVNVKATCMIWATVFTRIGELLYCYSIVAMFPKHWLFRWIAGFALMGLLVPVAMMLSYSFFHTAVGSWATYLWPSAILLMGLDGPSSAKTSTIVFACGFSIGINAFLYAMVGAWTSLPVYLFRRLRSKMRDASMRASEESSK